MTRKKPVSLIEVFKVMAKHDFNVKEASQELQINKSQIYNMKSKNKDKWEEMLKMLNRPDKKEENDMNKEPTLRKVSSKKFKPVPSVKSALAEKHVGVTRRITGDAPPPPAQETKANKHPWQGMQPGDSSNMSKLYEENIRLAEENKMMAKENETIRETNEDLAGAINRANEEKEEIGKEFNLLVDDFNAAKVEIKALKAYTEAQPLEVEETVYAVKLGKVFVTPDLRLYGHHSAAQFKDLDKAKQIKDEVGGTLYKSVLMPVEGDSDAKDI